MRNGKSGSDKFSVFFMNRSWLPVLSVVLLLSLLGLLGTLQYRWLGQISESEKEQMQKRLAADTEHFTQDFNRTLQSAYFPFQFYAADWQKDFIAHYRNWQQHSDYPDLIKDFYFVPKEGETQRFDFEYYQFLKTDLNENFAQIKNNFAPIDEKNLVLRMPIYKDEEKFIESKTIETTSTRELPAPIITRETIVPGRADLHEVSGYLLLKLDENVIKEKLLPNLNEKYFSDGNFIISVVSQADGVPIFQTQAIDTADSSVKFFALTPDDFAFFVNQDLLTSLDNSKPQERVIFNRSIENRVTRIRREAPDSKLNITITGNDSPKIMRTEKPENGGIWTLNVRHAAGSLENVVALARRKSLAVSFGILFLLGASIILIFVSAQRAGRFAQRQVDFVSAVSHEFRTPLAVIYSAGENLTDGVISSEEQIAKYGNLIKREGKKLSQMVEQILEFAGARSGRKKYDRREIDVKDLIENALRECQPLIEEKDFTVERDVPENLPKITADANAVGQAIQNLIVNSIKYAGEDKWLKIAAKNGGGSVKIIVEDTGVGISKSDISQIFQPFFRAKSVVDAQIHGNGLGLSLVKQTIEAHGGRVSVESQIGVGSRFTIHLPLNI